MQTKSIFASHNRMMQLLLWTFIVSIGVLPGLDHAQTVGFWITAPDDSVFGTKETVTIGDTGDARNLPIDTSELPPGNWSIVFRGVSSGHTSIVYFRVRT